MKKIILLFIIFSYFESHSFSQINILEDRQEKSTENIYETPKYDSSKNITNHTNLLDFKMYVGQKIIFKYIKDNPPKFYCFSLVNPDTIWHKKSKRPKPNDYDVIWSYKYKTNIYKTFDGSDKIEGYTPSSEIVGKIFEICDVKIIKESHENDLSFLLKDLEGIFFWWNIKNADITNPPCVILSYVEKLKDKYIGKDIFHFEKNNEWVKYYVNDVALYKASSSSVEYSLGLIIKSEDGKSQNVYISAYPDIAEKTLSEYKQLKSIMMS